MAPGGGVHAGLVEIVGNYLKKGAKIYIEGQLETRKWADTAGKDHYATEIVLRPYSGELTMLDARKGDTAAGNEPPVFDDELV